MSPPHRRILMTTDAVGGVWTYSTALARALCARGDEVVLVATGPAPRPEQLAVIADVPGLAFEETDLALEWMDPEGDDIPRARTVLADMADRTAPDVIHLNSFREAAFELPAPVLVVAHSCVGSWWQACRPHLPIEPRWQTYLRNVASGLESADAWVTPTQTYRHWIERYYSPRRNGDAIWNGAVAGSAAAKQPFILAAGRLWDEAKNLRMLARIASALPWRLRVAGAMHSPDGEAACTPTGLDCLGELPHAALIEHMRSAAIFVAPALYEPFGLTILEAAGCGCALVLADIPSLRELWNGAALFVDPHDDTGFAEALRMLVDDEALRTRFQRSAQRRARRYSLDATIEDYCALYGRLTASLQSRRDPAAARAGVVR